MHVLYPNKFEAAPVRPKVAITSRAEDGDLSSLFPSLQLMKPVALLEVPDHINKAKLRK